ncbi:hypothetical protein Taro_033395 [Colocasia esculenta]|uniref:Uncharacterized protein n=1 Tax=Colocasia esculenta TaxID=4460 RepID=A0A843VNP2_COLES|nr:hypothetical protein [Colocasia esculenta]
MSITDPSHTFHSASSSGHHVTEEHVIEEDEEDEIESQDDIDDNENVDEGHDEPLFDIARVNNTKVEYEQDLPDIFTSDQWIDEAMLNNSHNGIDVPCTLEGEEPHVEHFFTNKKNLIYALQIYSVQHIDIGLRIEVLHCNLHLVIGKVVVHVADAFICIWIRIKKGHLIIIIVIVANQDIIEVHVQGYNPLITISMAEMDQLPGPVDNSVLYAQEGHRSQFVYIGQETEVLKCWEHHRSLGGWPLDPRIILTDEGMPDTQPPQSTVGTYRRQRRHRDSTRTLPQQSQFDLLGETLDSISEDMDSETTQSESCDAI